MNDIKDINDRMRRQLAFSLEIDKEKNIRRQTHLSDHGRRENDAEHAWHMAIMAYLLREYANNTMDNLQPLILNDSNEGGDWKEHGVNAATVYGRQTKTRLGSETLFKVTDAILQKHIRKGNLPEK